LLTAKATQEDKVTGLRAGADAYVQKPFDKEELLVRLEKLVELRRNLQERYTGGLPDFPSLQDLESLKTTPTLDDLFLQKIRQVILDKINDPDLGIVHLCRAVGLSNTQVFRKIKALTGENPTLFIRRLRLERAMKLLKTTERTSLK
jgi:DNA-binding response OmpR family regulator